MNDLQQVGQRVVKTLNDIVDSLDWVEPTPSQILHAAALVESVRELFNAAANGDAAALQAASERTQALAVVPL